MRELLNTEETVRFCKALSSPLRVEMLQYILAHEETSPNDPESPPPDRGGSGEPLLL